MSNQMQRNNEDQELLAGWVLGDLSDEESRALDGLLRNDPGLQDELLQLEGVAATLATEIESFEEMPAELRQKISSATRGTDASSIKLSTDAKLDRTTKPIMENVASVLTEGQSAGQVAPAALQQNSKLGWWREYVAWMGFAAAALVALVLWFDRSPQSSVEDLALLGSAAERRDVLLKESSDKLLIDWQNGTTPFAQQVKGDVVWSTKLQRGYMRFVGMPVNNPNVSQYQLWIIDPLRDDEPIDGGVFDITKRGEVIVEIDPKLDVIAPKAFAITVEKPGGVVVSTQNNLPLLAPVPEV